ncbi:CLUMA_CG017257, isoform A [Clunio marinus]|uniref:CLUMA_CG017257, isoform A n=1 Tax=Clunio marinus TaxID=568069 RepID=A0A1J1IWS6_9DIPT|nr:CLUMA_CG017257, isoform A [Clunio marinus]
MKTSATNSMSYLNQWMNCESKQEKRITELKAVKHIIAQKHVAKLFRGRRDYEQRTNSENELN